MAKSKTNALGDDYTAGNAPFAQRDVTSRYYMANDDLHFSRNIDYLINNFCNDLKVSNVGFESWQSTLLGTKESQCKWKKYRKSEEETLMRDGRKDELIGLFFCHLLKSTFTMFIRFVIINRLMPAA